VNDCGCGRWRIGCTTHGKPALHYDLSPRPHAHSPHSLSQQRQSLTVTHSLSLTHCHSLTHSLTVTQSMFDRCRRRMSICRFPRYRGRMNQQLTGSHPLSSASFVAMLVIDATSDWRLMLQAASCDQGSCGVAMDEEEHICPSSRHCYTPIIVIAPTLASDDVGTISARRRHACL